MFFGCDPRVFYSPAGLGPALMATFPYLAWIAVTSLLMLRAGEQSAQPRPGSD
jgi:hypothetical protein